MTTSGVDGVTGSARRSAAGGELRPLPGLRRDRLGGGVELAAFRSADRERVLRMYRGASRAGGARGRRPLRDEELAYWVDRLRSGGPNVIARSGRRVVGHAALVPDGGATFQLVVFVLPEYQATGADQALVQALLALGRHHGAEQVWSRVARRDHAALALYRRLGFRRVSPANPAYAEKEIWSLAISGSAPAWSAVHTGVGSAGRCDRQSCRTWPMWRTLSVAFSVCDGIAADEQASRESSEHWSSAAGESERAPDLAAASA